MALDPGARLGPYEIVSPLGAGGMGEVYKARDTRLNRTVALKILPPEFSSDPARRARFSREAQTISQLNHPHICVLHDVGEAHLPNAESSSPSAQYLVMEYLEGQTLAERLRKSPLSLAEALRVGADIADALAAAHRQGVIHRDLKPSNIMLARGGSASSPPTVKLLDFGLAKLYDQASALGKSAASTRTESLTGEATLVGTLPYMAPEQVEGRPTDGRTDIWALGCVLYEMVTGTPAFAGDSQASLITSIMSADPPPLSDAEALTPSALDRLVRRCLAKHPEERWDGAHDVADELRWISRGEGTSPPVAPALASTWRRHRAVVAAVGGIAALIAIGGAYFWGRSDRRAADARASVQVTIELQPGRRLTRSYRTDFAWTPDGSALVLAAEADEKRASRAEWLSDSARLYVRSLHDTVEQPMAGTEGAGMPLVSPDGQWVGFWLEAERGALWELRKVPLPDGGPPFSICQAHAPFPPVGASWGDDGTIVYGFETGALWAVQSAGGVPRLLTTLEPGEVSHRLPQVLPGSRAVLFTVRRTVQTWGHEQVALYEHATGKHRVLLEPGADARYVPTGHLVFLRFGTLLAVPFDLSTFEVQGDPVGVLDQVAQAMSVEHPPDDSLAGRFAVSMDGHLAVVRSAGAVRVPPHEMFWVDRRGRESPVSAVRWPGAPFGSRLSPDGTRAVVLVREPTRMDAWVLDLSRGPPHPLTRLTTDDEVDAPVWSPDGHEVVFVRPATRQIVRRLVGRSDAELVVFEATGQPEEILYPSSWSPGDLLAVVRQRLTGGLDIGVLDMNVPDPAFRELVATGAVEMWPTFSPDGKWLAYVSTETGRFEVYVRPYPSMEPVTLVRQGMGVVWSANGRELFFAGGEIPNARLTAVSIDTARGQVRLGPETSLFATTHDAGGLYVGYPMVYYSVTADAQRFLMHRMPLTIDPPPVTSIGLVLNWFEELKAKVPVRP